MEAGDKAHTKLVPPDITANPGTGRVALWTEDEASYVGKPGDAHQTLLDIVGLHSGSVEYHQRYAESIDDLRKDVVR